MPLARVCSLVVVAALALAIATPARPASGTSPACGVIGTLLTVGLLGQTHADHHEIPTSKLRTGWPKFMTVAEASARGLDRSTPDKAELATRFRSLVDRLGRAGAALAANDIARFWTTIAQAKPDTVAVSSLAKKTKLVCRDGHGTVTVSAP